jgi:squalene cyclase
MIGSPFAATSIRSIGAIVIGTALATPAWSFAPSDEADAPKSERIAQAADDGAGADDAAGDNESDARADRSQSGAENNPLANEMTEELRDAVRRGFIYLEGQQNSDGSFGRGRYGKHVGITALCALAFMSDGNLPGRGPYGEQVANALEFVLNHATDAGVLAAETSHGPMYGHGFATLFLGEIYGMNPDDARVRDALVKAVDVIVGTQNDEGGWRYNPMPYDADISVTICQIMALRSARNAGIKVPKATIDRAVQYVRDCQNPDGGFRYMRQVGGSAWPRTAAGVASLFYAGIYDDDSIDRGLNYLIRNALPGRSAIGQAHYYYGQYYAVQAMYLAGGEYWQTWWPAVREELLSRQSANGGWLDHYAGGAYSTAMSLIVLQMPKRYLPIFQK